MLGVSAVHLRVDINKRRKKLSQGHARDKSTQVSQCFNHCLIYIYKTICHSAVFDSCLCNYEHKCKMHNKCKMVLKDKLLNIIFHSNTEILLSFMHSYVVPNLYDVLSFLERRNF